MKELSPAARARYFRRQTIDRVMGGLCVLAAGIGLILLGLILWMLFSNGIGGLKLSVFTNPMAQPGAEGGLANAIVGSIIQVGLGAMIGAPIGMMVGVYLSEVGKESRFASVVRFVNDILLSAPSVLIGLFVYQIAVSPFGGFSGFAGALSLALIAMPIVARTTEDILRLVPQAYRDGAIALGSRENEVVRKVILPAAFGGILTGVLLAVARIAGETAPLLFTSLGNTNWSTDLTQPMASLPIAIYRYAGSPYPEWVSLAWTGAMLITVGVLSLNILSRFSHAALAGKQAAEMIAPDMPSVIATPAIEPAPATPRAAPLRAPSVTLKTEAAPTATRIAVDKVNAFYGQKQALHDVNLDIPDNAVTAFIGASGCGKSTLLRCLNRMNDTIPGARVDGQIRMDGIDINSPDVDPVQVRTRIGMVFQKPNPFPMSIYDNIAYGPRTHKLAATKADLDAVVEKSLRGAALWDEVKDRLKSSGLGLSGGQQQRLVIARTLAVSPAVILMDEPCSALDPIATAHIEALIDDLRKHTCIVMVTHSMAQAARVSQVTAFFNMGKLVESGPTDQIFTAPKLDQTQDYITGRFG